MSSGKKKLVTSLSKKTKNNNKTTSDVSKIPSENINVWGKEEEETKMGGEKSLAEELEDAENEEIELPSIENDEETVSESEVDESEVEEVAQSIGVQPSEIPSRDKLRQISFGGDWAEESWQEEESKKDKNKFPGNVTFNINTYPSSQPNKGKLEPKSLFQKNVPEAPKSSPMDPQSLIATEQFILDTLDQKLESLSTAHENVRMLTESHTRTLTELSDYRVRMEAEVSRLNQSVLSLITKQKMVDESMETLRTEYFNHIAEAPKALEEAEKALSRMMEQLKDAGLVIDPEALKAQERVKEQTEEINKALEENRARKVAKLGAKKVPAHLKKFLQM